MNLSDRYRGKKVMITGGLGFIGSNLAHRLVELGAEVLIVDSLIPDHGGNLFNIEGIADQLRVNIADVRDRNGMDYLVRGQEYIFNLAGQVSHMDSMRDPYTDLEINCRSQLSLLEACRYNNPTVKIVYASTRQIYGTPDYLPVDERHLVHPTDVNGINKMAGEWYHILYSNIYGVRATSLRLTNTYGPRQLVKHNRQGFIGWFIRLAVDGEEISLYGDGKQLRDLNHVDDVIEAFLLAGASNAVNGEVFNLGGTRPVSLLEIVDTLIDLCPEASYRLVPFPEDKKRIDIGDYYGDYSKIETTLGWKPQVSLRDGLADAIEFYRQNKEHYWE
jgi:UDP-glucose 4-epimerase